MSWFTKTQYSVVLGAKVVVVTSLGLGSVFVHASECPTAPTQCDYTQASFGQNTNLNANQTLCINAGTFNRNLNGLPATATIYVAEGATFEPGTVNNPSGELINCGTANLPNLSVNNGFKLRNFGTTNLNSSFNFNGSATIENGEGATIKTKQGLSLRNSSTFKNRGTLDLSLIHI